MFRFSIFFPLLLTLAAGFLSAKPPREIWERYSVAFIGKGSDNAAFTPARQGARNVAKVLEHEHNLAITIHDLTPGAGEYADQTASLKEAFMLNVDAILISVQDPEAIAPVLDLLSRQDVVVVTFDGDAPASQRLATIETDERALGQAAMQQLAEKMPRGGRVAILAGPEEDAVMKQRLAGAQAVLEEHDDISTQQVIHCASDFQSAVDALSQTVAEDRDQEIDAWLLLGRWPLMGAATLPWDPKRTPCVSVDALPRMLPYLAKEEIDVLVAQLYYRWGYLAMETAINAVHLKQAPPETVIQTGNEIITRENLPEYTRSWASWMQ